MNDSHCPTDLTVVCVIALCSTAACDMLCPSNTPISQIATIKPRVIEIFKDALGFMLRQTDSTTGVLFCT